MASKQELLREAQAFTIGLGQPRAPTACSMCIQTFALRLHENEAGAKFLMLQCPSFFTTVMRFFSEDWTESRRVTASAALRRAYAACRKCNPAGLAIDERRADQSVFAITCFELSRLLVIPLAPWLGQPRKGNPYANRRGHWPNSAEELFPVGPTLTITALVTLLEAGIDIEYTLLCVLSVDRPLAFPAISSAQNRALFIAAFVARWRAVASAITSDLAKLRPPVLAAVRDRIAVRHIQSVQGVANILLVIFVHPDHQADDGPSFIRGHEEEISAAMDAVLGHLEDPKKTHENLQSLAALVWGCVLARRGGELGDPATPWYVRAAEDDASQTLQDPYLTLRSVISQQTTRRSCHARNCAKPVHEKETSGAYSCCSRCSVARYCSRECQRADWAHASYPHRAVCPMLRELFSFADMTISHEQFAALCRVRNFPLGHVDRLIEWAENRDAKEKKVVSDFEHGNGLSDAAPGVFLPELGIVIGKNTKVIMV